MILIVVKDQILIGKYNFSILIAIVIVMNEEISIECVNLDALKKMADQSLDQNRLAVAGRLSFDLVNLIQQQIQTNQFEVNSIQKDFKLRNRDNKQQAAHKRINDLTNRRASLHQDLNNHINQQDENSQDNSRYQMQNKYFKSQMTQEDLEKIKRIKIMQKKYQMELENRTRLYEESLKKFHEEERELLEKQRKEKNQERLKQVAKNVQEIRNRQQQRRKKMEEQKKKLIQLRNGKKLYEKLDEQYRSVQLQEQKKKQQIKLAMKLQKTVKFDEIKEHQKKYEQIMKSQKQEREKKLGELVRGNSKKYYHNRLLKDCIEQEQKHKIEHEEKKNEIKQQFLKKEEYAQYVRNNYRPNVPLKEDNTTDLSTQNRSLSVHQLHKMGNDYMKQAHQNLQNLKGSSISKVVEKKEEPLRYKNYLKQMQVGRKLSSQKQSRVIDQIDNLMKRQNLTQQEKFFKAKLITQKIQQKQAKDSHKLIQSINAKIYLLKQIQPKGE